MRTRASGGKGRQMGLAQSFRDLVVYQAARAAAKEIFEISKRFPPEERYSLTDQIRRASRSVGANTAEGWRKRRYPAAFISKLSDADGEAGETRAWLDSALDCGYITQAEHRQLDAKYDHICAQLFLMMDGADKWCATAVPPSRSLGSPRPPQRQ